MSRQTHRLQRPKRRRNERPFAKRPFARPRFEQLEDRRLLAAMSLLPTAGNTFQQNGATIVSVAAESTVRFVASIESAESPVRGFVLNFGNSSSDLVLDDYAGTTFFPDVFDGVLDSNLGDYVVGGGSSLTATEAPDSGVEITSSTPLGTFDVTVPAVAGDYDLRIDFDPSTPRTTQLVDVNGVRLPITDFGSVVLRVADPNRAIVTTSPVEQSVLETDGSFVVTVSLSKPLDEPVVVPYTIGGTATSPSDFVAPVSPLVIPAGETSAEIVIVIINDFIIEEDETVTVSLGNPSNASVGAENVSTTTIVDDDSELPKVTISATDKCIPEDGGSTNLIVTLSKVSELDVTIPYSVAGSATGGGVDYVIGPNPVMIPAGETTAVITLDSVDDLIREANETVIVRLDAPTNANLGTVIRQVVTIIDDDQTPAPNVSLTVSELVVDESAGLLSMRVVLSAPSDKLISVPFTVGGTAARGADYTISNSPITFEPGTTLATIALNIIDDDLIENDETVSIVLGTPSGASLGAVSTATITILNNDFPAPPKLTLSTAEDRVSEDVGFITFKAKLSEPRNEIITAPFTISGTMTYNLDYANRTNQVRFNYGETEQFFRIYIVDDREHEADEQLTVTLGIPSGAELGNVTSQTVVVEDNDDPPPLINFSKPTDTIAKEVILKPEFGNQYSERINELMITATLAFPRDFIVRVPYSIGIPGVDGVPEEGMAVLGRDFVTVPSEIVFMPGETTSHIVLMANEDSTIAGPSETVVISISESIDATAGDLPSTTITIVDTLPDETEPPRSDIAPQTGLRSIADRTDVDRNGETTAFDALLIVNHLSRNRSVDEAANGELVDDSLQAYDVNGDGLITAFDALLVINRLNEVTSGATAGVQSDLLGQNAGGLQAVNFDQSRQSEAERVVNLDGKEQPSVVQVNPHRFEASDQPFWQAKQAADVDNIDAVMASFTESVRSEIGLELQ